MKRKLKLIPALCLLALCLAFTPAFAQESEEVQAPAQTESEGTVQEPLVNETEQTVSAAVAAWFADHSTEIFSALTLCGSLILAFLYKKGFLPILSGALSNMSSSLSKGVEAVGEATNTLSVNAGQTMQALSGQIEQALAGVKTVSDHAGALARSIETLECDLKASSDQRARMETVLASQMQLFYDFFMAVNLPQYQKERLGAAYNEMLAALKEEKGSE
ncbi:MAG: hypothetical protein J6R40_03465 [Clostridia bacterium]|nr:hypothetical protein [Clostridia bacterium]